MTMKALILLCLAVFVQTAFAQDKTPHGDQILFEQGFMLEGLVYNDLDLEDIIHSKDSIQGKKELAGAVKKTILLKALQCYQELIGVYPKSKLLYRALNNKGFLELELGDTSAAKATFQQILQSNANDKEKGGIGSGIMAEPYANYKNRVATTLAELFLKDSHYTEALKYLDLTKKYPYQHFCGNELAADEIYMAVLYGKCYMGLNDRKKALEVLFPNLLENGLADNTALVELTYRILIQQYSKEELKTKFAQSLRNYQTKTTKTKYGESHEYSFVFLDIKIPLNTWKFEEASPEEVPAEIEKALEWSKFYNLLNL